MREKYAEHQEMQCGHSMEWLNSENSDMFSQG